MENQSNTSTSIQEGLSEAADAAEQAVESNSEESGETQEVGSESADTEQLAAKLDDPKASKKEKEEIKRQLKKLKLKIDGEEVEEEFDLNDDEYLRKQLQLAKVAQKRMQEKASIEKEVLRFIEDLRKDPRKALSDPAIGLDLKKLATQIIEEEIENAKKSPEQLEKEKLQAELQAIKEEREREKEEAKKAEFDRLKNQALESYDNAIDAALSKTDLPKSPYVVKKIADYMLIGLQNGKDISVNDVMPLVREEIQEDLKSMFAAMPDEVVEKLIGKDKINSIRKRHIQKAKQTPAALKAAMKTTDTGKIKTEAKTDDKKMTFKDFFKV